MYTPTRQAPLRRQIFAVGRRVCGGFASLVKGRWPSAARPEGLSYGGLLFKRSGAPVGLPYSGPALLSGGISRQGNPLIPALAPPP